jgi:GTPase involved in cell partitioning and DNA repair
MIKITIINGLFFSTLILSFTNSRVEASDDTCLLLTKEIAQLEKDLIHKNKLLAKNKHELEKLPLESTSKKMKLTSETFITAAESETTQNWIEVKKREKIKACSKR